MSSINLTPRKNKPGAGRKVGTGKFKEPTTAIRIPTSQETVIKDFIEAYRLKKLAETNPSDMLIEFPLLNSNKILRPLYSSKVPAGFPSPADDHVEKRLSPNDYLIEQEDATFFVTIQGYSMIEVGLMPGDKAVVDRSKNAKTGDIVLAIVDGEFTIKILNKSKDGAIKLLPANSSGEFKPIESKNHASIDVWGVVTGSFRKF